MLGVKILPRIVQFADRVRSFTQRLSASLFTIRTALKLQLPVIAVLSLFSGCNRPGSINLPYEIAKNPDAAAAELFKLACTGITNVKPSELKTFKAEMEKLNPSPLETPWVAWRGANFVAPPCPVRTCPKPATDAGVKKPEIKPDSKPAEIKPAIKKQGPIKTKKIQRQAPDAGVKIKL